MRPIELDTDGGMILRALRASRAAEAPRVGVHVSTILNDMHRQADPKAFAAEMADVHMLAFQEAGNAIEDIIARELARRIPTWVKPKPRSVWGIVGSPDGYSTRSHTIDEMKACWKSERDFLDTYKFDFYVRQVLFYLSLFNADRGRLHVLFINGDYKPPRPRPRTWILRPTAREKMANLEEIHQHGVDMGLKRQMQIAEDEEIPF